MRDDHRQEHGQAAACRSRRPPCCWRPIEPELVEQIFDAARQLKRDVYGNRIVLFAPLYIGNDCTNDCIYCAFRRSNREEIRRTLDEDEIRQQVLALEKKGHKRLILVFGEHPHYDARVHGRVRAARLCDDGRATAKSAA